MENQDQSVPYLCFTLCPPRSLSLYDSVDFKASGKKKRKVKKKTEEDLYALLGLQHERWTATDAQLKLGECPAVKKEENSHQS